MRLTPSHGSLHAGNVRAEHFLLLEFLEGLEEEIFSRDGDARGVIHIADRQEKYFTIVEHVTLPNFRGLTS